MDFVPAQFHFLLQLREVQNAGEVEREVHIQVNVEQRVLEIHRVQVLVEFRVVFVLQVSWRLAPQRRGGIDDARDGGFNFLDVSIFVFLTRRVVVPFGLGSVDDLHRHELAVLGQNALDAGVLEKFCAVVGNVQHDVCTAFGLLCCFDGVLRRAVTAPLDRGGVFALAPGDDIDLFRDHEGRIESETKVADDSRFGFFALVLIKEFGGTRECDLVDVLIHFLLGHADAAVSNGQRLRGLVANHLDGSRSFNGGHFAQFGQRVAFLGRIDRV